MVILDSTSFKGQLNVCDQQLLLTLYHTCTSWIPHSTANDSRFNAKYSLRLAMIYICVIYNYLCLFWLCLSQTERPQAFVVYSCVTI